LGRRLLYQVRDVMRKGDALPAVGPEASIREAVGEMSRASLGAVCVTDSDCRIVGILTEGDVRRLFLEGMNPNEEVREVMTTDPKVIGEDVRLGEALDMMEAGGRPVYVLPVVDDAQRYVGMLRMHDIVGV